MTVLLLTVSLLFLVNIFLLIFLLKTFQLITDLGTLTNSTALDSLISFNILSAKIRNSIAIAGLLAISYGLYDQNKLNKGKLFLYSSYLVTGIIFILIVMMIMAGGFIL